MTRSLSVAEYQAQADKWADDYIASAVAGLAKMYDGNLAPVTIELVKEVRNDLQAKNAQLAQQLAEAQAEIAELRQRLAASRKANSKLLKEANAEIKAFRGILGAEMGALDSEIDDMIYDWMEAEDEVPSDDIEDN